MTDQLMIDPAVVATTLLVARIIDFVIGVICGGIIEKVRMPWGKYRSWLLVLRWVIVFAIVCSFFDTSGWPMAFRIGVSFIGYILLNVGMSFTTNAYYGLGPALAGANPVSYTHLDVYKRQFVAYESALGKPEGHQHDKLHPVRRTLLHLSHALKAGPHSFCSEIEGYLLHHIAGIHIIFFFRL